MLHAPYPLLYTTPGSMPHAPSYLKSQEIEVRIQNEEETSKGF